MGAPIVIKYLRMYGKRSTPCGVKLTTDRIPYPTVVLYLNSPRRGRGTGWYLMTAWVLFPPQFQIYSTNPNLDSLPSPNEV